MLATIAKDIETHQTEQEQSEKSKGRKSSLDSQDSAASDHGQIREQEGFDLDQMVSEYRAMRASVLRLWSHAALGNIEADDLQQMTRFNEAIDQAITESTARFNAVVNQQRELFLAAFGHDLRTPLSTIVMSAEHLLASHTQTIDEQYRGALTRILNSGTRMKQMINDLLDFTMTRMNGGLHISRAAMDFGVVVRRIVDELEGLYPACLFQVSTAGDLNGAWDEVRIGQLVANLIMNAVHHGSSNTPIIITVQGEPNELRLVVHNVGPLIAADHLSDIFEPLKRGKPEQDTQQGTPSHLGLGLYIARLLMASKFVGVRFSQALRAALPIYVVFLATITFAIYFPSIVLWLPKQVIPESVGCFKSPSGTGYICPK